MKKGITKMWKNLAIASMALGLFGCGSASNNDQGTSFLLYGFFQNGECTAGLSGASIPLATGGQAGFPGLLAYYGVQNNLARQGVRGQRALLRFFVEGSDVQPPTTTVPMGFVLGPVSPAAGPGGGSLPPGFDGREPTTCIQNLIVPPEIVEWLVFNKGSLPDLPFTMSAEATVVGLSTAGDRLETNPLAIPIVFVDDVAIDPTTDEEALEDEASGEVIE